MLPVNVKAVKKQVNRSTELRAVSQHTAHYLERISFISAAYRMLCVPRQALVVNEDN
jgi:hypothetical protein